MRMNTACVALWCFLAHYRLLPSPPPPISRSHALYNVCCCLSLLDQTKRRENIYRQSVCANFLVSMISQHSNNGCFFLFWFFSCFCDCCCNVGVPFNTQQHNVWMSLVCNPCSIYCMLSFPIPCQYTLFNRLSASRYYI